MIGSVEIKTRPLRLAYLVDPGNAAQVREAIRLASTLWGGIYCPIIPLYRRTPANWLEKPFKPPPAEKVIRGYLEALDPDVLVQLSVKVPDYMTSGGLEIVKGEDIWSVLDEDRTRSPRYGLGIFELLGETFREHFRYKAKYPMRVILPTIPRRLPLFWAAVFGEVPARLTPILDAEFREPLGITDVAFTPDDVGRLMSRDTLFPSRITRLGLTRNRRSGFGRKARVFFLDASKVEDVVDFWNLRLARAFWPYRSSCRTSLH